MKIKPIILVIADITGYTDFIKANKTSVLHAEEIISELVEAVIENADYPLELNKLEGDAVLMYADARGNWIEAGQEVVNVHPPHLNPCQGTACGLYTVRKASQRERRLSPLPLGEG
ncbi:MAG: hypothetical protein MAG431_00469 [Chloroflexi bacterium]|nr:hypothetical protein [Chloroflexota bacterium]